MDCSLSGSSSHGILQARILEWVSMPSSRGSFHSFQFSSVAQFSLRHHGLQHARPPCPSPTPRVYSNSCPLNQWCHPTITSSVIPFSSYLQSFPASGSFPMSRLFALGGRSIGALAIVLPMNIQGWFPLGLTGLMLQCKGLSRVFSSTTVGKYYYTTITTIRLQNFSSSQTNSLPIKH